MSESEPDTTKERIIDELDGVLPERIDRRRFLHGSLSSVGAMMLAGCTGDGGGDATTSEAAPATEEPTDTEAQGTTADTETTDTEGATSTGEATSGDMTAGDTSAAGDGTQTTGGGASDIQDDTEATFTTPWKKEPSWGTAHVAEGQGYWEDAGVPGITATRGNGSDTEAQQIGVGNKEMGISSFSTALGFIPGTEDTEELNMRMVAMARGRPLLSLIWRKDEMEDRADLAGKNVLLASGFAATTWSLYPSLVGVNEDEVTAESSSEEVGPAQLANNQVQAVWGSIDLLPEYEAEVDAELGVTPLTTFGAFAGFPIWVNGGWFDNKENNVEFMSAVITGYFKTLKWALLNQEEYLEYLQNEVNTNLQTWTEEELTGQHSVLCAQAVTLPMKDEGLGYFTEEGVQFSIDNAAPALLDDPDTLPETSELYDRRAWEASEKVTFTDSEWDQLAETAGETWTLFEEAESGNSGSMTTNASTSSSNDSNGSNNSSN